MPTPSADDYVKQFAPPPPDDDDSDQPPPLRTQPATGAGAPTTAGAPGDDRGLQAALAIRHALGVAGGQVPSSVTNLVVDPLRFGGEIATGRAEPDMAATYPPTTSAIDAYEAAAGRGATEGAVIGGGVGAVTGGMAGGPVGALGGGLVGAGSGAVSGAISGLGSEFVQRNFPNSLWGYGPEVTGVVLGGGRDLVGRTVRFVPHVIAAAGHNLAHFLGMAANHVAANIVSKSGPYGQRLVHSIIGGEAGVQNQTAGYQQQEQQQEQQQPANGLLPPAAQQTQ